jgi:predicted signal transduction protein with EAL and GGDEF domain
LLTDAMSEDQDFIAAADAALYEAKAAGRDCVRFDQETSEQIPEEAQRPNAR